MRLNFAQLLLLAVAAVSRSTRAVEKDLLVLTVAASETDGLKQFLRSTSKHGLEVKVLGLGKESTEVRRVDLLHKELETHKLDDNLIILFTENYDVVFTGGAGAIQERFAKFEARIVFSADGFCRPDDSAKDHYPLVKRSEKRFLNSAAFIGHARELYEVTTRPSSSQDEDDDQRYYTSVFLDREQRARWNIKLDTRSKIFQNLNGALDDVVMKFRGRHSYVYNKISGTSPAVLLVRGDGRPRTVFNRMADTLVNGWTAKTGCMSCRQDTVSLAGVKLGDYPTVLLALFLTQPTPFTREFFQRIAALDYPKNRIDLYVYNKEECHQTDVTAFMEQFGRDYQSVTSISLSENVREATGRNWAIEECLQKSCEYYLSVEAVAQLTSPHVITTLIEQNRSIIAPFLRGPLKFPDYWEELTTHFTLSEQQKFLPRRKDMCLWNVPLVRNAVLVHGQILEGLRHAYTGNPAADADASFCQRAKELGYFLYQIDEEPRGHLVDPAGFETFHVVNELFNIRNNPYDWALRYLHPDYFHTLKRDSLVEEPCPGVYWMPIVSDTFCREFVREMDAFGKWSSGSHYDPRLPSKREAYPTIDIHMDAIGFDKQWLFFLALFVNPLQKRVYPGYVHFPPEAKVMFIARYRQEEQPSLAPHHDASIYTINIALNTPGVDFEGGGCRFIRHDGNCDITALRKGWTFLHPGGFSHFHEGLPTTNGTRYILVSFVVH